MHTDNRKGLSQLMIGLLDSQGSALNPMLLKTVGTNKMRVCFAHTIGMQRTHADKPTPFCRIKRLKHVRAHQDLESQINFVM